MKITEIKSLTVLRGIAAIIVVIYHYASNKNSLLDATGIEYFVRKLLFKGYLSVDLFFILSSFVLLLNYNQTFKEQVKFESFKNYMIKRFVRLYPVYFICTIAYVIIKSQYVIHDILLNVFFLQSLFKAKHFIIGPSWSLSTEWFMYLLFPFLILFFNGRNLFLVVGVSLFFLIGSTMFPNAHLGTTKLEYTQDVWDFEMKYLSGTNAFFKTLGNYLLGFVVYTLYINKKVNISSFVFIVILCVSIILSVVFINDVVTICFLAAFILSLSQHEQMGKIKVPRLLYFFGEISYSLYLLHMLPVIFFEHYDFHLQKLITKTICLIISVGLSYLSFKYLEIPIKNFLTGKIPIKWIKS